MSLRLCALTVALATSTTLAQPVLVTSNLTVGPTDTAILGVPLATADITVEGATLTVDGAHTIRSLEVRRSAAGSPGVVTHSAAFSTTDSLGNPIFGATLTVSSNCTIQGASGALPASSINVAARGYARGVGPGSSATNSGGQCGASYAGRGGFGTIIESPACYGSFSTPDQFGSGSPLDCGAGHSGGGSFHLIVGGTLTLDGLASANAGTGGSCGSGGASGGSIWIYAGTLAGSGSITASGGNSNRNDAGGGGGGRIAVYYTSSTFSGSWSATGGNDPTLNPARRGGAGSIWIKPLASPGTLTFDNGGTPGNTSDFAGETTINGNLQISNGAFISHFLGSSGTHLLVTGDVQVGPGAGIDVSGRGFVAGQGPGSSTITGSGRGGAAHGGRGGDGSIIPGHACYGSLETPTTFGSGGPMDCGAGGRGGGALQLSVGLTLLNDGVILADAITKGAACGSGGAAGGSLFIEATTISGSGLFSANGAPSNRNDAGGGGGGRIALYYETADLSGSITAYGGNSPGTFNSTRRGGAGTIWLQPSSDLATLIIDNGGFPGQRTDFSGEQTIASNLIVDNEGSLSHPAAAAGTHLTFLGDVTVAPTGRINVDGRGYPGGQGPGSSNVNTAGQRGAGHGGRGGDGSLVLGGACYGSVDQPTDLGSGGPIDCGAGTSGGGALRLTSLGTLTIDGSVSSNAGTTGASCGSAGAAGGSLWLEAATVTGTGTIAANGGISNRNDAGGGGGGRIAIYSSTNSFAGSVQCFGNTATATTPDARRRAGAGTIWTQTGSSRPTITINNNGNRHQTTDFQDELALDANLVIGPGGVLSHPANLAGTALELSGDVTILAGGAISVTGRGFPKGQGPGSINFNSGGQGGAGHGGAGGRGTVILGGLPYGNESAPVTLGSGSGLDCNGGGSGGGALRLFVDGSLIVDGELSANGDPFGAACGSSGAAGGSLWIKAASVSGSGVVMADGSAGNRSDAGGGGGGRIAIYSCDMSIPLSNIHARGGTGWTAGAPGSVFFGSSSITVTQQPVDISYVSGILVELEVAASTSQVPSTLTYQWRRRDRYGEYQPLIEGFENRIYGTDTAVLSISDITCTDGGYYDCLVTDICGSFPTLPAFVSIIARADYDDSGYVDGDDIIAFFADWDAGLIEADFNEDGGVDGDDVISFFYFWDRSC